MTLTIDAAPAVKPKLDPDFIPAVLWNQAYRDAVTASGKGQKLVIGLERANGSTSTFVTNVFPHEGEWIAANVKYVERLVKYLLWMKGGHKVTIAGSAGIGEELKAIYAPNGKRSFDHEMMGERIYGKPFEVAVVDIDQAPTSKETTVQLGGNLDGNRIGFDLGGSDRKCAAVVNGEVVFSEEIPWDPYFQENPDYHLDGIRHSLKSAAEKMPRVDAIGGSAAGVYVDNQVRIASLFRGVPEDVFKSRVTNMFLDLADEWKVPFVVINDGEVTALAGAMSFNDSGVLGIAMGTSQAVGYVNANGNITDWLNELAFAPVDYRDDAPVDEWSGDAGCGVQYFSQQAVARLAPKAGLEFSGDTPFPERLVEVQKLMANGDERARAIYETIGVYFGYSIAHYAEFYELKNLLSLGRVTSGEGGDLILSTAADLLKSQFPALTDVRFRTPDEKSKRHGQAVAAASLPATETAGTP